MKLGLEVLLSDEELLKALKNKRVSYVGHPASVTRKLEHGLHALHKKGLNIVSAFGPQHGILGEKQDNMIESEHSRDSQTQIPVHSLYSEVRRPTDAMLENVDVLLVDMQDVGCRVYTYLTTLLYLMEACAQKSIAVWVLDRPNPAGRPFEGFLLDDSLKSFVGASRVPLRHGLTLAEMALFLKDEHQLDLDLKCIAMKDYSINSAPGWGWPVDEIPWVNPSPNMPTLCTARCYGGTVLLEGTLLSEGRGSTRPLQLFGAPQLKNYEILQEARKLAPSFFEGCLIREAFFEPTFHKFKGELCSGWQIHVDSLDYQHHRFQPLRLMLALFRSIRNLQPDLMQWRQPPYEYEHERLPIDLLLGNTWGREWVDNPQLSAEELDRRLKKDEDAWNDRVQPFLLYR